MRFQVTYSTGTTHEVDLPGSLVVLGRDPGCDIVLNDTKCSRRHAVVETGPQGFVIRDSGSANGVNVNGRRVDSSPLKPGDTIRLGDVQLTLLAEIGETVVVAPDDLADLGPGAPGPAPRRYPHGLEPRPPLAPAREPAAAEPAGDAPGSERGPSPPTHTRAPARPTTVSVLSTLWALAAPVSAGGMVLLAARWGAGALAWASVAVACLALTAVAVALALGLWTLRPWARHLQVVAAYLGLLVCPLTLVSATVLLYMARQDVKRAFDPRAPRTARGGVREAEMTFAISIVAMLVVGLALGALALLVLWPKR